MGQAGSTNRVNPTTSDEAARLELIMGKDREALGRGQLNKAVQKLGTRLNDTANRLDRAINMVNTDGTSKIATAAQLKERDRQNKPVGAKVDTGLVKKKETSSLNHSLSTVGGSIPTKTSGGATAKNARRSKQRMASLTKLTWRDRIANAERKAGAKLKIVRLFMAAGHTVMSEHPKDFLHALPPILTDALGEKDAERFTASLLEIGQYIFAKSEQQGPALPPALLPPPLGPAPKAKPGSSSPGAGQMSGRGQQLPQAPSTEAAPTPAQSEPPPAPISPAARQRIIAAALRHVTASGGHGESVELRVTAAGAPTGLGVDFRGGGSDGVDGATSSDVIKGSKLEDASLAVSGSAAPTRTAVGAEEATVQAMTSSAAGHLSGEDAKKIMDLLHLLQVYINSANSRLNPPAPWHTASATDMLTWSKAQGGKEYDYFSDLALTAYKNGQVAIYIDCSGEGLQGAFFHSGSCPYALAQGWNAPLPVGGVASKQIRGLPLGQRQLTALHIAVEKLLGKPAMDKIKIVLTLAPEEESLVVKDLIDRNFYGFSRRNVLLLVQERLGAYSWAPDRRSFAKEDGSEPRSFGGGYAIKQLGWIGECITVGDAGAKEVDAKQSALSLLAEAGVHAITAWKCGDLGRLIPEDVLDVPAVAHMYKSEEAGAACAVQVNSAATLRDGVVVRAQFVRGKQLQAGMCVALSPLRCNTADAAGKLAQVKEKLAPTCRWQFLVQPLATALGAFPGSRPTFVWTPCMRIASGEEMKGAAAAAHTGMYPEMDVSDLTTVGGLPCAAYRGGAPVVLLRGPESADTMLRVVGRQDSDANFQEAVSRLAPAKTEIRLVVSDEQHKRFTVVLLVADSPQKASLTAFKMASQLLRPGVDELILLHVARDTGAVANGDKVFDSYVAPLNRMLHVRHEIVVAGEQLPVVVEQFCDRVKAHLVVMGSEATAPGGKVLGSMAIAVARKLSFPLLVVKADAETKVNAAIAALKAVQDGRVPGKTAGRPPLLSALAPRDAAGPGFRVMLGVEAGHVGIEMLRFTGLLLRKEFDTIVLARCANYDGSQNIPGDNATARLLASFEDTCRLKAPGFVPIKKVLAEGKGPMGLVNGAARDCCDILVHQAPPGTHLPQDIVDGLAKVRSAMLIYRHTPQFDANDEKWSNYTL